MKIKLFVGTLLFLVVIATLIFIRKEDKTIVSIPSGPSPTPTLSETQIIPTIETQNPNPKHPSIMLTSPIAESTVSSPLVITGEARGNWFFEATFPVILTNWDGLIIAETYATANGEWMTEDFVPFTAEISFDPDLTVSNRGSLILQKANPSDLPENDDAYEITVYLE